MKEDIKADFEKLLTTYDTRQVEGAKVRQAQVTAREQFERQYRQFRDSVMVPALKEIATQVLEPRGWRCDVRTSDKDVTATLEVYRDDMYGIDNRTRPHIKFSAESYQPKMSVYASTPNQGGPEGSYDFSELTAELVQDRALKFFKRLVIGIGA